MPRPVPPATFARLARARERLQDAPEAAPRIEDLAAEVGLSRAHFLRSFASAFGRTPHEYLTELRLDRAKRALARGASVTEACFDVGFASLGTFSRMFAARVGVSGIAERPFRG